MVRLEDGKFVPYPKSGQPMTGKFVGAPEALAEARSRRDGNDHDGNCRSVIALHLVLDLQLVLVGGTDLTSFQGEEASPMLENQALVQATVARGSVAEATS